MWLLVGIALFIIAAAMVILPFFRTNQTVSLDVDVDPQLLALYNRRDQLYQAIREARFDLDTGKLSPEDYERQVARLKRQAASVLKAIDRRQKVLASADLDAEVEAMVRAERQSRAVIPPPKPAMATTAIGSGASVVRYCPQCGTRVRAGDRFCPACGVRLE